MSNITMLSRDAVSAKLATCFVTIEGERFLLMNAIDMEAKFDKSKTEVPILGRTGYGNKANGWKGSGRATFHYNQSVFRKLMQRYKASGDDVYFEMQVCNEDPGSAAGRQTVVLKDCNLDGGVLAKFDADGEILDEEMSFTFEDFEMPEAFAVLDGMRM